MAGRVASPPFSGLKLIVPRTTVVTPATTITITIPSVGQSGIILDLNVVSSGNIGQDTFSVRLNNDATLADYVGALIDETAIAVTPSDLTTAGLFFFCPDSSVGQTPYMAHLEAKISNVLSATLYKYLDVSVNSWNLNTGASSRVKGVWIVTTALSTIAITMSGGRNVAAGSNYAVYGIY